MNIYWFAPCLKYRLGIFFVLGLIGIVPLPGMAQITPDETLGNERSRVNRNVQVRGGNADRIEGGASRGANLFHSFSEFNVNEGQRVYFANPSGIGNILSRVTGSDVSDIMGTLGVEGGANLFMLNPNGIIFGPNARLDISGSFVSSTADSFTFLDGTLFSATNPGDSSLLSVTVPLGVQYGPNAPGAIANAGNLAVGQNLRLSGGSVTSTGQLAAPSGQLLVEGVAGDVQVRSAIAQLATFSASNNLLLQESQLQTAGNLNLLAGNTVWARDSAANPFVAYAGGNLTVQGNQGIDIFALNHPSSGLVSGGDMVLRSANTVGGDAHYWSGGNFRIEQLDGDLGNLFSPYDPVIRTAGNIEFESYEGASLHIFAGGSVTISGTVTITAADNINIPPATLSSGDEVNFDGTTPALDIRAGTRNTNPDGIEGNISGIRPNPPRISTPPTGATISVGNVIFDTNIGGTVLLTNQDQVRGATIAGDITVGGIDTGGPNGGGDVYVDSRGGININGRIITSDFSSGTVVGDVLLRAVNDVTLQPGSVIDGNGTGSDFPKINIQSTAGSVFLREATITADNFGSNFAGDIVIGASREIRLEGNSTISTDGDRGRIFLGANRLEPDTTTPQNITINNSEITSTHIAAGRSGAISLLANQAIEMDRGRLRTDIRGTSLSGSLSLETTQIDGRITLRNSSTLSSDTYGLENAGSITIRTNQLSMSGGSTAQSVSLGAGGNGGDVTVNATSVDLRNSSNLFSDADGSGDAGSITINTNQLSMSGGSTAQSVSRGGGNGGDVTVNATSINLTGEESGVTGTGLFANALGTGNGGDIRVTTGNLVITDRATINVGNFQSLGSGPPGSGNAGDLTITTDDLTIRDGGVVTVDSAGRAGNLEINANSIELDDGDLTAIARSGSEGDIEINLSGTLLQLYDNSTITAGADGEGDGGDVTINAENGFVLADPYGDSDILANAVQRGGNITINTNAIFGLEERDSPTEFSDINAESEFSTSGNIILNTLNIDPTRGLGELETEIVDAASLVAEGCVGSNRSGVETQGEFTRSGRGGLSPDPTGTLTDDSLIDQSAPADTAAPSSAVPSDPLEANQPIVEAQGLARNVSGKVSLVPGSSNSTVPSPVFTPNTCDAP